MPELPEVETTRRGIRPHVLDRRIEAVQVRQPRLRWPVAPDLHERLAGSTVTAVDRRAKYLLVRVQDAAGARAALLVHLGMSGSLRLVPAGQQPGRHDHADLLLDSGWLLRFHDPRRFGSLHWHAEPLDDHPLLRHLGPEPFDPAFSREWLQGQARGRRVAIKALLMDARVVTGVGNIYASEALFRAGIHPARPAGNLRVPALARLVPSVREVLESAIEAGGTTLRDFVASDGRPGYFRSQLLVYGRDGQPCLACGTTLRRTVIAQRGTCWCPRCQRPERGSARKPGT